MLPHELSQSRGSVASPLGHGLCLRCFWGRWGPKMPYLQPSFRGCIKIGKEREHKLFPMFRLILQALGSVRQGVLPFGAQMSSSVLADPAEEGRGRQRKAAAPPATPHRFPLPAWGGEP